MLEDLKEWSITFVKHKDIFSNKLVDYRVEGNTIKFNFKDRKHTYIIMPELNDSINENLKDEYISVICLNKMGNVKYLIKNWEIFIKYSNVNVIFVNPYLNEKWIINPNIHERISERESLAQGLKSMFETVPEVR